MTGKITPLYVVCSPRRCVGKTLISRLLIEFYVVKDRSVVAFIFSQFRHLEFSLGDEEPSAVIVDGSRQPHTATSQRAIGISEQVLYHPPKQQRRDDNPIDQFGNVIVAMLQKAAEVSSENCARSKVIASELSLQLRATEDRINALETEIEYFRDRAFRAETWLQRIQREIEQKLIAPPADAAQNTTP